jgi:hypothetical protein
LKDQHKRQWLHLRRKENRWRKLFSGFASLRDEDGVMEDNNVLYDMSKIPDVWDNLYYDMVTHRGYIGEESCKIAEIMVGLIHPLNEWVCVSEYGLSREEKLQIGVDVTWRLIGKILSDLEFMIDDDVGKLDEAGQRRLDGPPIWQSDCASPAHSSTSRAEADNPAGAPEGSARSSLHNPSAVHMGLPSGSSLISMDLETPGSDSPVQPMSPLQQPRRQSTPGYSPYDSPPMTLTTSDMSSPPHLSLPDRESEPSSPSPPDLSATPAGYSSEISYDKQMGMPMAQTKSTKSNKAKLSRLTPELRNQLKHALRDVSDWHPRLNDEVQKLTDIKNTRIVRSRIYVTSASTMHSLFNILRHGHEGEESDGGIAEGLEDVIDLKYLTHIVFRCYERNDECNDDDDIDEESREDKEELLYCEKSSMLRNLAKSRYRVEISMSPGKQVFQDGKLVQWPEGSQLTNDSCIITPLQIIAESVELSRVDDLLTEIVKEYGAQHEANTDNDKPSDG